jgi:hypothetical protein
MAFVELSGPSQKYDFTVNLRSFPRLSAIRTPV